MMDRRITAKEAWPAGWKELLGNGHIAAGLDPATTTKKKSNPSAIAITERRGDIFIVRSVTRFKTDKPDVTRAVLREALALPEGKRVERICVLATSERFFAADLNKFFPGQSIESVIESEATEYRGERMLFKVYLGNLVVNLLNDGQLWLPSATWLRDDIRQTKRTKGTFESEVDEMGNHADCFCAIGASVHALLIGGGDVEAMAVNVGSINYGAGSMPAGLRNPDAAKFFSRGQRLLA